MGALLVQLTTACTSEEVSRAPDASVAERAQAPKATLQRFSGEVSVKRAAGDDWSPAAASEALFENDKVRTARGATALIRFGNGSEVALGGDALIAIAETRPRPGGDRTDLTVFKGRIDAELDKATTQSLSVTTPSATVRAGREIVFQ